MQVDILYVADETSGPQPLMQWPHPENPPGMTDLIAVGDRVYKVVQRSWGQKTVQVPEADPRMTYNLAVLCVQVAGPPHVVASTLIL